MGDGCTDGSGRVVRGDRRPAGAVDQPADEHRTPERAEQRRVYGAPVERSSPFSVTTTSGSRPISKSSSPRSATASPAAHTSVLVAGPRAGCVEFPAPGWSYTRGAWVPPTSLAIRRSHALAVGGWRAPLHTGSARPRERSPRAAVRPRRPTAVGPAADGHQAPGRGTARRVPDPSDPRTDLLAGGDPGRRRSRTRDPRARRSPLCPRRRSRRVRRAAGSGVAFVAIPSAPPSRCVDRGARRAPESAAVDDSRACADRRASLPARRIARVAALPFPLTPG